MKIIKKFGDEDESIPRNDHESHNTDQDKIENLLIECDLHSRTKEYDVKERRTRSRIGI